MKKEIGQPVGRLNEMGRVEISQDVIALVAARAVAGSPGVLGLAAKRPRNGAAQILPPDDCQRGVNARLVDGRVVIDLWVVMQYGVRVPDSAETLMSSVKQALEKALGIPIAAVNVNVQGLRVAGESAD